MARRANDQGAPPEKRRKRRWSWFSLVVGSVLSVVFAAFSLIIGTAPTGLNAEIFDAYQRLEPRAYDPSLPVRIVDIDEESLDRYGQWPWPRPYFAELLERLTALGAAVVVFDFVFAEPDRTSPELLEQSLHRFDPDRPAPPAPMHSENDVLFSRTIAQAPVVLGALPRLAEGSPPPPIGGLALVGADPSDALVRYGSADAPLEVLRASASGLGVAGIGDGRSVTVRRMPVFLTIGDKIMPSLAAEALRVAQGAGTYVLKSSAGEAGSQAAVATSARIGAIETPLSGDGTLWVRYAGPQPERLVPAWRVLEGAEPDSGLARHFEGQIVLVGASAPGLRYLVATPLSEVTDGVTVHAEVIEQMLLGINLFRPDWAPPLEALQTLLLCLAVTLVLSRHRPFLATGFLVVAVAGLFGASWYAFSEADMLIGPGWPVLGLVVTFGGLTLRNYFRSDAERQAVRSQFERFVSADVISEIMDDPEHHLSPGGELRDITIMFMDVRNFSTHSEGLPPDVLIRYMNSFLDPLTEEILGTSGTIDKYIGDAIMAFWNAPLTQPDHPDRAISAALAMRRALDGCNERFAAEGLPRIEFGIGINTGPCSVGLVGSSRRLDYSCIGDAANVASRLEGLTKTYGVWNCIGDSTVRQATRFLAVQIDDVTVKGRQKVEPIWTVLGQAELRDRSDIRTLVSAIAETRSAIAVKDFDAARTLIEALPDKAVPEFDPSRLAQYYRRQIGARSPQTVA